MLRIAYIATEAPFVKPKKLSRKDALMQEAIEGLEVRKASDRVKAKQMFTTERANLNNLYNQLEQLENAAQ